MPAKILLKTYVFVFGVAPQLRLELRDGVHVNLQAAHCEASVQQPMDTIHTACTPAGDTSGTLLAVRKFIMFCLVP